jgi:hypothetical protein
VVYPPDAPPWREAVKLAFIIVACVLFVLDAFAYWAPGGTWGGRLQSVGLAFFAASFIAPG